MHLQKMRTRLTRRATGLEGYRGGPQQACDDVFRAMDEIDRSRTTGSMKQTATVLEGHVSRARLQLERNRSSDAATANLGRSEPCRG